MKNFVGDFLSRELDNFLHRNPSTAEALKKNRTERNKRTGGDRNWPTKGRKKQTCITENCVTANFITTMSLRERTRIRSSKSKKESTIFITEGDSASGSITKARQVDTQAVFSLRGKPLNCYGLTKKWCMKTKNLTSCNMPEH